MAPRILPALLLSLLAFALGCAESDDPPAAVPTSAPSLSAEEWQGRYELWLDEIRFAMFALSWTSEVPAARREAQAAGIETWQSGALAGWIDQAGSCSNAENLVRDLPDDLAAVREPLEAGCAALREAGELARRSIEADDPELSTEAVASMREAAREFRIANDAAPEPLKLVALPLATQTGTPSESRVEPTISDATLYAGPELLDELVFNVNCWSPADWDRIESEEGAEDLVSLWAVEPASVNLPTDTCDDIGALAYADKAPEGDAQLALAAALWTLMREATRPWAIGGGFGELDDSEETTACLAVQYIAPVARELGADASYARALARRYWTEIYPSLDEGLRSPECKNGGALDARVGADIWP